MIKNLLNIQKALYASKGLDASSTEYVSLFKNQIIASISVEEDSFIILKPSFAIQLINIQEKTDVKKVKTTIESILQCDMCRPMQYKPPFVNILLNPKEYVKNPEVFKEYVEYYNILIEHAPKWVCKVKEDLDIDYHKWTKEVIEYMPKEASKHAKELDWENESFHVFTNHKDFCENNVEHIDFSNMEKYIKEDAGRINELLPRINKEHIYLNTRKLYNNKKTQEAFIKQINWKTDIEGILTNGPHKLIEQFIDKICFKKYTSHIIENQPSIATQYKKQLIITDEVIKNMLITGDTYLIKNSPALFKNTNVGNIIYQYNPLSEGEYTPLIQNKIKKAKSCFKPVFNEGFITYENKLYYNNHECFRCDIPPTKYDSITINKNIITFTYKDRVESIRTEDMIISFCLMDLQKKKQKILDKAQIFEELLYASQVNKYKEAVSEYGNYRITKMGEDWKNLITKYT